MSESESTPKPNSTPESSAEQIPEPTVEAAVEAAVEATAESTAEAVPAPDAVPEHTKEELRLAMKAFRKRLKLTRLDDESRMGYGPTSSGQGSRIVSITPPNQYPSSVWQQLARQGKLKREGGGLYTLIEN